MIWAAGRTFNRISHLALLLRTGQWLAQQHAQGQPRVMAMLEPGSRRQSDAFPLHGCVYLGSATIKIEDANGAGIKLKGNLRSRVILMLWRIVCANHRQSNPL